MGLTRELQLKVLPGLVFPTFPTLASITFPHAVLTCRLFSLCSRSVICPPVMVFLGRKVMTNLDGIFKSRDITLPTKVHLVKAMVFPVVMYGCERWTVKKAECQRIDALEL